MLPRIGPVSLGRYQRQFDGSGRRIREGGGRGFVTEERFVDNPPDRTGDAGAH